VTVSSACNARRFTWINEWTDANIYHYNDDDDDSELYENDYEKNPPGSTGFLAPFIDRFPEIGDDAEAVNQVLYPKVEVDDTMVFYFRVQWKRGCYRTIQCGGGHTFDDLHNAIQTAFGFDDDHLYAFFMDGKRWSRRAIHSPNSDEYPHADEVLIGQVRLREKQPFMYLFDFGTNGHSR